MGMEILWFRHFSILLGEFRAVFALLLAIILLGIGAGSLAGAHRGDASRHPAQSLIVVQAMFVAATLPGLAIGGTPDRSAMRRCRMSAALDLARRHRDLVQRAADHPRRRHCPRVLMGFAFPLANAIVPAHGGPSSGAARRALSREHVRRRLRIARDRFPAAADARDSAERDGADGGCRAGDCGAGQPICRVCLAGTAVGGTRPTAR